MKIHDFLDTKSFMSHAFEAYRVAHSSMTIERYAAKLELGTSSLKMILSGKRRATTHQILSVARSLRLSPEETSYLETLGLKEAAKTDWEKSYYLKILRMKKKEIRVSTISTSQQKLISDPVILPLLVYFMENGVVEDQYSYLASQLGVTPTRIRELIEGFKENKILAKQPDGSFHVMFDKLSHRFLQKKYQKQLLALASSRIDTDYESLTSFFTGYAFTASDEALIQLQMDLKSLMNKYMTEANHDRDKKHVAQACFQLFPVIRGN
jgi:uncharacterized protein (TIGR02147 family)